MITDIYLARHGETEWNQSKKLQGQLDSPLTPTGRGQAETLALKLASTAVTKIFTSPLGRAQTTAEICQQTLSCPVEIHEQLQERHFGDWQGLSKSELKAQGLYTSEHDELGDTRPPNGESALDCALRFYRALENIAKQHLSGRVLIVSHGDIIRCFNKLLLQTIGVQEPINVLANGDVLRIYYQHNFRTFSLAG